MAVLGKLLPWKLLILTKYAPSLQADPGRQEHSEFRDLGSEWQNWALVFFHD